MGQGFIRWEVGVILGFAGALDGEMMDRITLVIVRGFWINLAEDQLAGLCRVFEDELMVNG